MSLLLKVGAGIAGITKLSELEIDADKDWQAKGITNVKAIAEAMEHGDIVYRGAGILERLTADAGKGYNFLRSRGPGMPPVWQDIESLIQYMTAAINRAIAVDLAMPTLAVSQAVQQASSPPGRTGMASVGITVPGMSLAMATGPGGGVTAVGPLAVPAPSVSRVLSSGNPLSGAVADDGGIQADETTAANNDAVNDMTLLPAAPAIDDAYYFGLGALWDYLRLNIGTSGVGVWTLAWEYWNGFAWSVLPGLNDGTSGFTLEGWLEVNFTRPADWAVTTVGSIANLYWIRARVSSYDSVIAQPKGSRAFCFITH
jgi:hypothetical protein